MDLLAITTALLNLACLACQFNMTKHSGFKTSPQTANLFTHTQPLPYHKHLRPRGTRAGIRQRQRIQNIKCVNTRRPDRLNHNRGQNKNNVIEIPQSSEHNSPTPSTSATLRQRGGKRKQHKIEIVCGRRPPPQNFEPRPPQTLTTITTVGKNADRKRFKPPLPSIITGNVQSINNKVEELCGLSKYDEKFRTCSLICLTETWLQP